MTREQKIAKAREMRGEGRILREICSEIDTPRSTIGGWLYDPDGSKKKARQARYGGTCVVCGARTDGSQGKEKAPRTCKDCAPDFYRHWTKERICERIQEWVRIYGRAPSVPDWNPWVCTQSASTVSEEVAKRKMERFRSADWPNVSIVQQVFGSWTAGLSAAGVSSNPTGYAGHWEDKEAA